MAEFVGLITATVIFYILVRGLGQKEIATLLLLCGFLSFITLITPLLIKGKEKALEAQQDFQNISKAIDRVGQSMDKISKPLGDVGKGLGKVDKGMQEAKKTKEQFDELTEKTKIPGIDSVDKAIEEWFKKIVSGEKKGE